MRIIYLKLVVIMVFSSHLNAQTLLGPRVGLTLSDQSNIGEYNVVKSGFEYGLFYRLSLNDKSGIMSEILVTQKGYKKIFDEKLFDQLTSTYLTVQIMYSYNLSLENNNKKLFLNVGAYYGRWLFGKYAERIETDSKVIKTDYSFTDSYDQDGYRDNRNEVGLAFGVTVPITKSNLFLDVKYFHGLTAVSNYKSKPSDYKKIMNRQVTIALVLSIL